MAKHHPDLIFCRKQPGVGEYSKIKKNSRNKIADDEIGYTS